MGAGLTLRHNTCIAGFLATNMASRACQDRDKICCKISNLAEWRTEAGYLLPLLGPPMTYCENTFGIECVMPKGKTTQAEKPLPAVNQEKETYWHKMPTGLMLPNPLVMHASVTDAHAAHPSGDACT
eukprot:1156061-Pelagomonas_calceolata.AAC.7